MFTRTRFNIRFKVAAVRCEFIRKRNIVQILRQRRIHHIKAALGTICNRLFLIARCYQTDSRRKLRESTVKAYLYHSVIICQFRSIGQRFNRFKLRLILIICYLIPLTVKIEYILLFIRIIYAYVIIITHFQNNTCLSVLSCIRIVRCGNTYIGLLIQL